MRESRVRVPDRAAVVRDHVRDALGTLGDLLHAAQLELRLVGGDAVHREAAADLGRGHAAMVWASTQFQLPHDAQQSSSRQGLFASCER